MHCETLPARAGTAPPLKQEEAVSKKVKFSTRLTREDVAGIVEAVVEGLKEGLLKVQKSNETLELSVPRVIDLEVEGSAKEDKESFSLEISWRPNREENPDIEDGGKQTGDKHKAKTSMREAAEAAEEAAKHAGYAVKKTAGAASALFRKNKAKLFAEVEEFKTKHPKSILSRAAEAVEAAARRAGKVVKDAVNEAEKKSTQPAADTPVEPAPEATAARTEPTPAEASTPVEPPTEATGQTAAPTVKKMKVSFKPAPKKPETKAAAKPAPKKPAPTAGPAADAKAAASAAPAAPKAEKKPAVKASAPKASSGKKPVPKAPASEKPAAKKASAKDT